MCAVFINAIYHLMTPPRWTSG